MPNLIHTLGLASTYRYYEECDEPKATMVTEQFKGCADYIFFSAETLKPMQLMTQVSRRCVRSRYTRCRTRVLV